MAWTLDPTATSDDIAFWEKLMELWYAARERVRRFNADLKFPSTSSVYQNGVIDAVTATSITSSTYSGEYPTPSMATPWVPTSYQLVIDDDDPRKVVKANGVTPDGSAASNHKFGFDSIIDYVTTGRIPDLASLVGKKWYWIRAGNGLWWDQRVPEFPNASFTYGTGNVRSASITTVFDDSTNALDATTLYGPGNLTIYGTTYDLLVSDGTQLRRVQITGGGLVSPPTQTGTITSVTGTTFATGLTPVYAPVTVSFTILDSGGATLATGSGSMSVTGVVTAVISGSYAGKHIRCEFMPAMKYSWPAQSWTASLNAAYWIIATGRMYWPNQPQNKIQRWYGGLAQQYWTHRPDNDSLGGVDKASESFIIFGGDDCLTENIINPLDVADIWTDPIEPSISGPCNGGYDRSLTPNTYKSFRGLQAWTEGMLGYFTPPVDHSGDTDASGIDKYVPATFFDAVSGDIDTADDSSLTFSGVTPPYTPIDYTWAIVDSGKIIAHGETAGFDAMGGGYSIAGDFSIGTLGVDVTSLSIRISYGWKDAIALRFSRMWGLGNFVPAEDGAGGVVFPPTSGSPGQYHYYPPSTKFLWPTKTGLTQEGYRTYQTGDLARYVGTPFGNTYIGDQVTAASGTRPGGRDPQTLYRDRAFVGIHSANPQARHIAKLTGTCTSGTTWSFTDTSQSWREDVITETTGVSRTQTIIPTGGSATTITYADASSNPFFDPNRYNGYSFAWEDFTVKITHGGIVYKNYLANCTATGMDMVVTLPFSVSAADTVVIEEPQSCILNPFKGRTVTLTWPDGFTVTTSIKVGDDDTQILANTKLPRAVDNTTTYVIDDPLTDTTWKWNGATWEVPTGVDPRNGKPFPATQEFIQQGVVAWYGKMKPYSILQEVVAELKTRISLLIDEPATAGAQKSADAGMPEDWSTTTLSTSKFGYQNGVVGSYANAEDKDCNPLSTVGEAEDATFGILTGSVEYLCGGIDQAGWDLAAAGTGGTIYPSKSIATLTLRVFDDASTPNDIYGQAGAGGNANSAYLNCTTGTATPCTVDFYNFATTNGDVDEGTVTTFSGAKKVTTEFKSFGDDVNKDVWTKFTSDASPTAGVAISQKLGNVDEPGTPDFVEVPVVILGGIVQHSPDGGDWDTFGQVRQGYDVTNVAAVIHWNFVYR